MSGFDFSYPSSRSSSIESLGTIARILDAGGRLALSHGSRAATGGLLSVGSGELSNTELMNQQVAIQRETLAVNLQTNTLRAEHDAKMSCVRNLKP